MSRILARFIPISALLAWAAVPSPAYVEAIMPLQQVLSESTVIVEGTVESRDATKQIATIKVGKSLKGRCTYELIRITYGGGQSWHPEGISKHFVKGAPAVLFYNDARQALCYLNRFFFQLYGDAGAPAEKAWWSMTHIEIRMNRTYNGAPAELAERVRQVLAGKDKAPAPVAKIPAIELSHVKALPAHGEPMEEASLPLPFRRHDPNAKAEARAVAVNGEGFLQRWLVLGAIPLGEAGNDHSVAVGKDWIPNQKSVRPAQHDKGTAAGQEFRWEVRDASDFMLDFGIAENTVSLALTYILSDADLADATLLTGSDDSAVWWLNGQEVHRFVGGRPCGKDQDRTAKPVALRKGVNVLLTAVTNGTGSTQACARFVDKAGKPVLNLRSGAEAPK